LTPDLIFCRGVLHKQSFVGSRCGAAEGWWENLVCFTNFGILYHEKIWQPW
jgi:hypothetical protein